MDDLTVSATSSDTSVLVAVKGDVDLATAEKLHVAVGELIQPGRRIDLHCAEVDFLDSAGIRVLLDLSRRSEEAGGSLALRAPSDVVCRVLELAGVARLFTIRD